MRNLQKLAFAFLFLIAGAGMHAGYVYSNFDTKMGSFAEHVSAIAACIMASVAILALFSWKKELEGSRRYELVKNARVAIDKLERSILNFRNIGIVAYDEKPDDEKVTIHIQWWKNLELNEQLRSLENKLHEIKIYSKIDVLENYNKLRDKYFELQDIAVNPQMSMHRMQMLTLGIKPEDGKYAKILYRPPEGVEDVFGDKVRDICSEMHKQLES
jgi:hypothetical protein